MGQSQNLELWAIQGDSLASCCVKISDSPVFGVEIKREKWFDREVIISR